MHSCTCASDKVLCRRRWRRGASALCLQLHHTRVQEVGRCARSSLVSQWGAILVSGLGLFAGGSGCTLTFSHDFSTQTVVNHSCGRSSCRKRSALVLLCRGTTSCLAFKNTNIRKQLCPFEVLTTKSAAKLLIDSACFGNRLAFWNFWLWQKTRDWWVTLKLRFD